MIRAGNLRYKVSIWNPTHTATGHGEYSAPTWTHVADVCASIEDMSATESLLATGAREFQVTKRIVIRSDATIRSLLKSGSEVRYGARVFEVVEFVDLEGRNREIIITAIERKASA